ncbi:hypothetical protein NBRC10513v2_002058 [Rhodotorula toruloides]|uniref:BY PROTMAP: gi/472588666/gb/EMS26138.1/ alkaline phosphatase D [Rhodosporidium toruloides NP11] gi/647396455/emb/CDR38676.1/ RHTO0S03e12024g1_1 [Rhodosporidium toruloides] n=1 Tax=Rhodotorula toruloides TaxID=5286 RepID=A0A0K3CNZ7_RHOTO
MGLSRGVAGLSSALLRTVVYIFLRWIPGRFGPYLIPAFFALYSWYAYFITRAIPRRPSTPAEAALVPKEEAPSFAEVVAGGKPDEEGNVVHEQHPHVKPDSDAPAGAGPAAGSRGGSLSKRQKKNRKRALNDPLSLLPSASDSEPGSPTSPHLNRRQKLPRNRPLPKTSLGQLVNNLVFGTPTTTSRFLNIVSWSTNALLFALATDFIWTPIFGMDHTDLAFVRVGAVSHTSVKLVARIPPSSSLLVQPPIVAGVVPANNSEPAIEGFLPEDEFVGAKVVYRPTKPLGKWIQGPEIRTKEADDWVSTVKVDGLWASTEYEYRLLRPSLETSHHPAFPHSQHFTTFSDPALSAAGPSSEGTHYVFASSSCIKPGFPYTGPHHKLETKGAKEFLKIAERVGVKFMLFLGDIIYSDVPWYAGKSVERYFKHYRQLFSSPEVKAMVEKIPLISIWDDHEIHNDYDSNVTSPAYAPAKRAFETYIANANHDPLAKNDIHFDFRVGDSAFFVWDTRTYRSDNAKEDDETKTMLGERQKEEFFNWVARVNQTVTWKFVVSSVPLMSLWGHGEDTWAAFLTERDAILNVLEHVPNVIVLSGDRHEFAAASLRNTVTEFSTSPMNMFYLPIRTLSQKHGRGPTGEDALLKYLPDGNTKFTTFEVDTRTANKPVVRVKVYIDGDEAWSVDVLGQPLPRALGRRGADAVEGAVGSLGKGLKELVEWSRAWVRRSWFS